MIILWQFELCPYCKSVREKLGELNLDFIVINAGRDDANKKKFIKEHSENGKVPLLIDTAKCVNMGDSEKIIEFLEEAYGKEETDKPSYIAG